MPSNWIVHLCTRHAWHTAQLDGEYRAESLLSEGFIHCSKPEQMAGVANQFYRSIPDLVLLWIDPARLVSDLKWEAVDEQVFPHIYGPLNLQAVLVVSDYLPDTEGFFRQPSGYN